jgi:hypothetical protein
MFDVFYIGTKPNLFAHEQQVKTIEQAQQLTRTRFFWMVSYLVDYTGFDFLYEPVPWQSEYTHTWPTPWKEFYGTYLVPKHGDIKYHYRSEVLPAKLHIENYRILADCKFDTTWLPHPWDPPYIYVFGNQWHRAEIMPTVEYHTPGATERKFVPGIKATLDSNSQHWMIPQGIDTISVDTSWVPDPGAPPYIYQFATQHQKTGGPVYTVPGATEVKYLAELKILTVDNATAIYEIDHLDGAAGQIPNVTRRVRYFDNYRDTLIRLDRSIGTEHEFVWVCSSICDYTNFDFSWHPEQWQAGMLHVFASDEQKFGDTFFMHVPSFAAKAETVELLDWYDCNFVERSVPRRPMPIIQHDQDCHVDVVRASDFAGPLAVFTQSTYMSENLVTVSLWREQTKTIVPLNPGASSVVVPRAAIPYIKTQLYDYPYIDKTRYMLKDQLLDIVFIQNGEPNAAQNFKRLNLHAGAKENRLVAVNNINGRAAAYHAAAEASTTPWFFAVFAKLEIDIDFNWTWQPDRMQEAKHYIFHAKNPCNGLIYGHQAMIAYNRQLVLDNPGVGLDFTLDSPHEVVPILSGIAHYDTSPWSSWRTAFRECIKLKASLPDVENEYRLNKWLDVNSDEADPQWSRLGAEDAVEYYKEVSGDFDQLKKSYEWEWLASYAFFKRQLTTNQ